MTAAAILPQETPNTAHDGTQAAPRRAQCRHIPCSNYTQRTGGKTTRLLAVIVCGTPHTPRSPQRRWTRQHRSLPPLTMTIQPVVMLAGTNQLHRYAEPCPLFARVIGSSSFTPCPGSISVEREQAVRRRGRLAYGPVRVGRNTGLRPKPVCSGALSSVPTDSRLPALARLPVWSCQMARLAGRRRTSLVTRLPLGSRSTGVRETTCAHQAVISADQLPDGPLITACLLMGNNRPFSARRLDAAVVSTRSLPGSPGIRRMVRRFPSPPPSIGKCT